MKKRAIIIGAGPAGLTAAYELLKRTDIIPVILEKSGDIGGISKTVNYKGNRIDIGGHRFFSKSDRVMAWWMHLLPVQAEGTDTFTIRYQNKAREIDPTMAGDAPAEEKDADKVMLVRKRLSRIYFLRKFFSYPVQLSWDTLRKLGLWTTLRILLSYLQIQVMPRRPEQNLEDFMINRFGRTLYALFFKDYTEKVWGRPCSSISAEWGAQRIKGISISKAIRHAAQTVVKRKQGGGDILQKDTETSLIEQFLYPKLGPGQLWEEVARQIQLMGGTIMLHQDVKHIYAAQDNSSITAVRTVNSISGEASYLEGDYFFSTMPVQELIAGLEGTVPEEVKKVAAGLQYRDFITVGILLKQLSATDKNTGQYKPLVLKDTWIYIQEKDVKVGRLQLFNNWSPYMVKDPDTVWVGMEFFCNKDDAFWQLPDAAIQQLAVQELQNIGLASDTDVLDTTVLRMEKTYPAYFGTYEQFHTVRAFTDGFKNLFLVGRNGMHKYNNSDHSMLTAMVAVDNITAGITAKDNIWAINTEQEYHEEKAAAEETAVKAAANTPAPTAAPLQTFKEFVFHDRRNKLYIWATAIALIIQFAIFKYWYPYASFINGDSYVYLETAYHNLPINTYPVGYSNFLRLVSVFTRSDTILVAFQYASLYTSILGLLFTVFYFYRPGKAVQVILLGFLVFDPVFLYLANYVSSDTLFLTLSIIWLTLLLWILYQPSGKLIVWHALVLFFAFTVRYNALFYPLITAIAFLLSRQPLPRKIAGIALGIILIGCFMLYTSSKYQKLSGIRQFSPFTGWQMANNALYTYRYIDSADVKPVPARFKKLDQMVRTYFDTTRDVQKHPQEKLIASTVYMWAPNSPLNIYKQQQFKNDSSASELKRWAYVGPLYKEYGAYLIRQYPLTFLQHYIWPNLVMYYTPPVEFLERYSTGKDSVAPIAQAWFGYKSRKIYSRFKDFKVSVLEFMPILAGTLNVVLLFSLLGYLLLNGYKQRPVLGKGMILVFCLWLANFGFSVFASPIALRFQLFPIVMSVVFSGILLEHIVKAAMAPEVKPREQVAGSYQLSRQL